MSVNKMGICEWVLPTEGPYSLELAAQLGYDGIQLGDLGGQGKAFPINNRRLQEAYLHASQQHNVELQSLHLYTLVRDGTMKYSLGSPQGDDAILSITKGVDACRDMNIPILMLSSFFASQILNDVDFINFSELLRYACTYGQDNGVGIVFECILHIDKIMKMLDAVKGLRLCYDTLNPIRFGSGDPNEEILRIGRENIDHVHVKDAPADLKGCCLLGTGYGGFHKLAGTLKSIGVSGWFITENYYCLPPMGKDSNFFELAQADLNTMRQTFA